MMSSVKKEEQKGSGGRCYRSPVLWTVDILPTPHFQERFDERVGGLMPEADSSVRFQTTGTLVEGRYAGFYYVLVPGVSRHVLKRQNTRFIGITALPRISRHANLGGS